MREKVLRSQEACVLDEGEAERMCEVSLHPWLHEVVLFVSRRYGADLGLDDTAPDHFQTVKHIAKHMSYQTVKSE